MSALYLVGCSEDYLRKAFPGPDCVEHRAKNGEISACGKCGSTDIHSYFTPFALFCYNCVNYGLTFSEESEAIKDWNRNQKIIRLIEPITENGPEFAKCCIKAIKEKLKEHKRNMKDIKKKKLTAMLQPNKPWPRS